MSSLLAKPSGKSQEHHAKIRKLSASQQIHAALRERIINLDLPPGDNLSRARIAEFYNVSQTPVRDAMMRLEEEGLLLIYPQSKTEVSRIDVTQARETQFLRISLEIEVTRWLASQIKSELLNNAEHALNKQRLALQTGDLVIFSEHDHRFHFALFEAANVSKLWELITERSGHIDRLRKLNLPDPGKATEIIAYHQRILDGIKSGDAKRTEAEVRGHLTGTLSNVDTIMERHPEFF